MRSGQGHGRKGQPKTIKVRMRSIGWDPAILGNPKSQLISEQIFGVLNFPKKQ